MKSMAAEILQDLLPRPVFLQFLEFVGEQEEVLFKKEITKKSWAKDELTSSHRNPGDEQLDRKVLPHNADAKNKAEPRGREENKAGSVFGRSESLLFLREEVALT